MAKSCGVMAAAFNKFANTGPMRIFLSVVSMLFVAGCFSQREFLAEACRAAFKSTGTVSVANLHETLPYVFEDHRGAVASIAYTDGGYDTSGHAVCEFAPASRPDDLPVLQAMNNNGNYLSEDLVAAAQSAIIDWYNTERRKGE